MTMSTSQTDGPTEPLLGSWSLTAVAALLVVGGILLLVPSKGTSAAENDASALHAPDETTGWTPYAQSIRANIPVAKVPSPAPIKAQDPKIAANPALAGQVGASTQNNAVLRSADR